MHVLQFNVKVVPVSNCTCIFRRSESVTNMHISSQIYSFALYLYFIAVSSENTVSPKQAAVNGIRRLRALLDSSGHYWAHYPG